jgi:hypothetical protein
MARRSEHKGDFFVEYSTDGTGRPGSSSLRPLGLKPVRPLRFRRKTCSQSRPKHNTLTPRTRARPLASQADKTRLLSCFRADVAERRSWNVPHSTGAGARFFLVVPLKGCVSRRCLREARSLDQAGEPRAYAQTSAIDALRDTRKFCPWTRCLIPKWPRLRAMRVADLRQNYQAQASSFNITWSEEWRRSVRRFQRVRWPYPG